MSLCHPCLASLDGAFPKYSEAPGQPQTSLKSLPHSCLRDRCPIGGCLWFRNAEREINNLTIWLVVGVLGLTAPEILDSIFAALPPAVFFLLMPAILVGWSS